MGAVPPPTPTTPPRMGVDSSEPNATQPDAAGFFTFPRKNKLQNSVSGECFVIVFETPHRFLNNGTGICAICGECQKAGGVARMELLLARAEADINGKNVQTEVSSGNDRSLAP